MYVYGIPELTSLTNIKSPTLKTITITIFIAHRYVIGVCILHANKESLQSEIKFVIVNPTKTLDSLMSIIKINDSHYSRILILDNLVHSYMRLDIVHRT